MTFYKIEFENILNNIGFISVKICNRVCMSQ